MPPRHPLARRSQGVITREEFLAALMRDTGAGKNQGHRLTRDQAEGLFDEADVDHNGSIDVEEFADTWIEFEAQYGMKTIMEPKRTPTSSLSKAIGSAKDLAASIRRPKTKGAYHRTIASRRTSG